MGYKSAPQVKITGKGDFKNIKSMLKHCKNIDFDKLLDEQAEIGKEALAEATPVRTGKTQQSWTYTITGNDEHRIISWNNSNRAQNGAPIVLLLVYGHGTRNGTYVPGNDFVTPAILPVLEHMSHAIWMEVTMNAK